MDIIWTLLIVFAISFVIAWPIAHIQNIAVRDCLKLKKLADDLLLGDVKVNTLKDSELLSLSRPMFTTLGFGGIGPRYRPSYFVWEMVINELTKRRTEKTTD